MIDVQIGRRYAEAIYDIAEEKEKIQETHSFLNQLMELYKGDSTFRDFINHPLLKVGEKEQVLSEIFQGVEAELLKIAFYLLEKERMPYIRNIVAEYLKIYYEKHQILDVVATFARELTEEQRSKLIQKLESKTKREIRLETRVDESILGGGVLKIGDQIIDGSLKHELKRIQEARKA